MSDQNRAPKPTPETVPAELPVARCGGTLPATIATVDQREPRRAFRCDDPLSVCDDPNCVLE